MTAAAIDVNILNDLFDNQKKLDDVFDSLFDDDSFITLDESTAIIESYTSFDDIVPQKSRSLTNIIIPVALEIAIIYYGVLYFV